MTPADTQKFWTRVDRGEGCWLWRGAASPQGYGRFYPSTGQKLYAHRVSFDLNVGVIPNGLFVCHTCDVRLCVRPEHLFLGSHQDNMNDMNAKGRGRPGKAYGELAHLAKLDWVKVREIRARYTGRRGEVASLAREYGISLSSMFAVVTGQTWRVDPCGSTIARVAR